MKNSPDWIKIGSRFKQFRESLRLSRDQMGELANQLRNAISNFELGYTPASTNYALFLRNEFGASFDWLYDGFETLIYEKDKIKKSSLDAKSIGSRLKESRKELGLTQKEFGSLIGLTHAGISNMENGHCKPEIKTALKIKRALNKPLDWIYFGDECITPKKRGINKPTIEQKPYIPLKQVRKELKEKVMSYVKNLDTNELSLLATRLRMENKDKTAHTTQSNKTIL
ncbi:helix-turn-helix domain-containing protein [Candidatus Liberibacter brunswickensis]|uniref:helix-turn-helix domain-containing protein n=1 Tax=Candidatus Liberibacter brunswickensis TaxID=1968796 RepID=UPI002FE0F933